MKWQLQKAQWDFCHGITLLYSVLDTCLAAQGTRLTGRISSPEGEKGTRQRKESNSTNKQPPCSRRTTVQDSSARDYN